MDEYIKRPSAKNSKDRPVPIKDRIDPIDSELAETQVIQVAPTFLEDDLAEAKMIEMAAAFEEDETGAVKPLVHHK